MKNFFSVVSSLIFVFILSGCSNSNVIIESDNNISNTVVLEPISIVEIENNSSSIDIDFENFENNMLRIKKNPMNFEGKEVNITGYLSKLEDDKLYYFISNDMCLGCDNTNTYNKFIEMINLYQLDLDEFWTDDVVTVNGIITIISDEFGNKTPVINIVDMMKI